MSEAQEAPTRPPIAQHLADAFAAAESGNYTDALAHLKEAKALEARNIYVLAFEKQVEQLAEFADLNILTDEQRTDILESIPGIIERALEGSGTDVLPIPPSPEAREQLAREREEKSAALEWLKNQYFQHAHEYVRKGEYAHALAEIRRVYIIDPSNRIAEDFERQINQLIALRKVQTIPRTTRRPPFAPSAAPSAEKSPARLQAPRPHRQERISSPTASPPAPPAEQTPQESPGIGRIAIIGAGLVVIALSIAGYYFLERKNAPKPAVGGELSVSGEATPIDGSFAPLEMAEQNYVVSLTEKNGNFSTQVTLENPSAVPAQATALDDFRPVEEKRAKASDKRGSGGKEASQRKSSPSSREKEPAPDQSASRAPSGSSPPPGLSASGAGNITEEARILRLQRPKFRDGSFAAGLDGQVVVQVEIDQEGHARQTRILRSTNDLLNAAVIDAVNSSEFSPRRVSGNAVNSWMTIPYTFRQKK
jgi:TonB family protein